MSLRQDIRECQDYAEACTYIAARAADAKTRDDILRLKRLVEPGKVSRLAALAVEFQSPRQRQFHLSERKPSAIAAPGYTLAGSSIMTLPC